MSEFSCPMTTLQYIMHPNYALQHRNHEINYEFIAKNQYINTQSNTCMSFSKKNPQTDELNKHNSNLQTKASLTPTNKP